MFQLTWYFSERSTANCMASTASGDPMTHESSVPLSTLPPFWYGRIEKAICIRQPYRANEPSGFRLTSFREASTSVDHVQVLSG